MLIENALQAIIIENKIYGAVDQESQLERYIECVIMHGKKESNIYVVYLTKDGEKSVDNSSFTQKAKNYLIASYNLRFASIGTIAQILAAMQKYNLGLDFLQKRW